MSASTASPTRNTNLDGSDTTINHSNRIIRPTLDGSDRTNNNNMGMAKRRDSKILLEGVEYDLSNLLLKEEADDDQDALQSSTGSLEGSTSSETSGYMTCRSRGTPSRNISNASSVFEREFGVFDTETPLRRDSPYRFDLQAMQVLMSSFRGIPELSQSFRLSKTGQVKKIDDESARSQSDRVDDDCVSGDINNKPEEDNHVPDEEVPGRVSVNSSTTTLEDAEEQGNTTEPHHNHNHHFNDSSGALDDLVYDQATGTYVYKDELEEEPQGGMSDSTRYHDTTTNAAMSDSTRYHDACQTRREQRARYTLEEMCSSAEVDDGEFDDEEHEMEISPGVYVPFRGAKETWQAVATHCTLELHCLDCNTCLVCINDCEFTVCPECRVVNPVFCDDPIGRPFGVGMGFKKEWVLKKQMLQAERERRRSDTRSLVNQASRRRVINC